MGIVLAMTAGAAYCGCGGSDSVALAPAAGAAGQGAAGQGAAASGTDAAGGVGGLSQDGSAGSSASFDDVSQGGAAAWDSSRDETGDIVFVYDAPVYDHKLTQDSACASKTADVEPVPLDIYLMVDKTGSMNEPFDNQSTLGDCNVDQTVVSRWCHTVNAIAGFIRAQTSVGMRVAIQFFSGNDDCNGAAYATPAVGLALLPGNEQPIINALNAAVPQGYTPTEGAIRGLTQYTSANLSPPRVMIGILVTDGDPTACVRGIDALSDLISPHVSSTGIKIYVVGMTGATYANLETWAKAGGGPEHSNFCGGGIQPCHHYDVADGDPQAFIQALQQIQNSAVACQYQLPTPEAGLLDPNKVIVAYLAGGTGTPQEFTRVTDAGSCVAGGFYYDNNNTPHTIILCPATCAQVQADANAKVQVFLGCQGS
jgi:hypothetical protein